MTMIRFTSAKKIYIAECTDLDTLTFTNLHQLYPSGMDTIAIDANLSKKGDTYYLAWCEQGTATDGSSTSVCKIASSTDLNNWSTINSDVFNELPFVEGIQIVPMNDRFLIYGDATTSYHYYVMKECFALNNTNGYYATIHAPSSLMFMRHGSVTYIDNINALNVLAEATEGENIKLTNDMFGGVWPTGVNLSGTITNLVIQPNVAYQISDNTTITNLYNPFRLDKVGFAFATAVGKTITITNIESAEGTLSARNRSLTNTSDINEKVCNLSLLGNCYWYK